MKKFEVIDFLKGYSIVTIVIFHYLDFLNLQKPFDKVIFFGGTGVHLFVLLSGFGLYYSHLKKPLKIFNFIRRRFLKIYVPYILLVLIAIFISLFLPIYNNNLYAIGGHFFLYKMFDETIIGSYGFQLWFVSMIFQFYISFYFIIWLKSKLTHKSFFILGFLISICWGIFVLLLGKENERIWNSFYLQFFWEFVLGMILAEKAVNNQLVFKQYLKQYIILIVGLLCCVVYGVLALKAGSIGKLFNDAFALIGYSFIAIFIYRLKVKPLNLFFIFVSEISLSIYLLHVLVLLIFSSLFSDLDKLYIVIISIVSVFPLSFYYHKIVSKISILK